MTNDKGGRRVGTPAPPGSPPRSVLAASLVLLAALALAAVLWVNPNGTGRGQSSAKLTICAGLFPLYDWARHVAGPDAEVTVLSGGGDPHHFEPSLEDIARLSRARVLLVIGLGLDPWARRAVGSGGGEAPELWEVGTWVARRALRFPDVHEKGAPGGHGHAERGEEERSAPPPTGTFRIPPLSRGGERPGAEDPHVWLDPERAAQIVARLGAEFARLDPAHGDGYRSRAAAYARELDAFAEQLPQLGRALPKAQIVVFHDAYGYLFDRLGLEVAGVVQRSSGVEPSARDVAEALQVMKAIAQRHVFAELTQQPAARSLAEMLGGRVVVLDHLTLAQGPGGTTYLDRLRYNVRVLVENLR